MANWAVVVGVDRYWRKDACLKGAVNDALNFTEWLVASGEVPNQNVFLLLGPDDDRPLPRQALRPTRDNIIQLIDRLALKSGSAGERLYFYYAGHGLSTGGRLQQALLPENFTDRDTQQSFSLESLRDYYATTQFREQFFFIDACRNVPWEGEFKIGEWPRPQQRPAGAAAPQQFVFLATSPGVKAVELLEAGNERGAFSDALLRAVRGEAKVWDEATKQHVVRVSDALSFIQRIVADRRLAIDASIRDLIQIPRSDGEHDAGADPVIAVIPEATTAVLTDAYNALQIEARRIEQLIRNPSGVGPFDQHAEEIQLRFNPYLDELKDRLGELELAIASGELRTAWHIYGEVRSWRLPVLANDLLAAIGGFYLRDQGLDDARLPARDDAGDAPPGERLSYAMLAERLVREDLMARTGEEAPPVLIVGEERPDVTGAVIRLRFPAWDIWNLPLTAHDYGYILARRRNTVRKLEPFSKFADEICDRIDPRKYDSLSDIEGPGYFPAEVNQFWRGYYEQSGGNDGRTLIDREKQRLVLLQEQQERLVCRLFADTFATLFGGPAYLYSVLHLRFWPNTAVHSEMLPFPDRFVFGMQILERMNNAPGRPRKVFDQALTQLQDMWVQAWRDSNLESTYDEIAGRYKAWVDSLYECFVRYGKSIERTYEFFTEAQLLAKVLRDPGTHESHKPTSRPNAWVVLNAAWLARAECSTTPELEDLMRNALSLLDKKDSRLIKLPRASRPGAALSGMPQDPRAG
jgi:uncharacterized caspase-like protein